MEADQPGILAAQLGCQYLTPRRHPSSPEALLEMLLQCSQTADG